MAGFGVLFTVLIAFGDQVAQQLQQGPVIGAAFVLEEQIDDQFAVRQRTR